MKQKLKQKNNSKHIPMRMCAVTREKLPKSSLVRIVLTDGRVVVDCGERIRGRGLNIKPDKEVFEEGLKRKVIERTFKIKLSEEELDSLKREFENAVGERFREKKVVRVSSQELSKLIGGKDE